MAFKRTNFAYLNINKLTSRLQRLETEVKELRWKLYKMTKNIHWIVNTHDECVISDFDDVGSSIYCMECPHNDECPYS